ncbi:MAG: YihY/virulence factor BrkB family protein [Clostridia bacterium]|nr:YihY/virulence factor BrkB family protein [Clostridia bacterium]
MKKVFKKIGDTITYVSNDHIDAFSAKSAFFIMLAFFPFVILILSILKFLSIYDMIIEILTVDFVPNSITKLIVSVVTEISQNTSITVFSISALIILWSSSVGMLSVSRGLNVIYRKNETRNYFVLRAISCGYTILLALLFGVMLIIMVFGNRISELIARFFPNLINMTAIILSVRTLVTLAVLVLFFLFVYTVTPNGKNKIKDQFPGAVFSALGWLIFSYLFSFYIDNISNFSYIYGSLTAIFILMLWLYFCMYLMFIGAEINMYLMKRKGDAKIGQNVKKQE